MAKRVYEQLGFLKGKSNLPGGESNPGLSRDRRGYSPLYYRGHEERRVYYLLYCENELKREKSCSRAGNRTPAAAVRAPNPNH